MRVLILLLTCVVIDGCSKQPVTERESLELAAAKGDALAKSRLGYIYDKGIGVPKDEAKAVEWNQKAAAQGHPIGQFNLGVMYAEGRGVAKNKVKAAGWYEKAAAQGTAIAQGELGTMYAKGRGVPKDDVRAYAWFNLTAAQDLDDAAKSRDTLEKTMTVEQKAQAQKLSGELLSKMPKE